MRSTPPEPAFTVRQGRLHVVPICHYRFEFAHCARRAILAHRPAAVAVELPEPLSACFQEAVARFPQLSVLCYDSGAPGDEHPLMIPVEPTDALAEAVRTAREAAIPVHFVDLGVENYPLLFDPMPDAYSIFRLGLEAYWQSYEAAGPVHSHALDAAREAHMARAVQRLLDAVAPRDVLLVTGMAHARGILRMLAEGIPETEAKPAALRHVRIYNPDPDSVREISAEMPFLMTCYEYLRNGPGADSVWENQAEPEPLPPSDDRPSLEQVTSQDLFSSLESLLGMVRKDAGEEGEPVRLTPEMMRALAQRLQQLRDPRLGLAGIFGSTSGTPPPLESAPQASPDTHRIYKFRNCAERRPELRKLYASCILERREADRMLDRQRLALRMLKQAAAFFEENTGETFHRWQMRTLIRFARNYARLTGMLIPDFWQWIVASRGVADDNFSYEVWDLGSFYPWQQEEEGGIPTVRIHANEMWLGDRKITFRRRFPRFRERMSKLPIRKRLNELKSGDWIKEFNRGAICSYPPEDVVIEEYGRYLKKKAVQMLSEERTRVEPFSTAMLDGIDVRETIRNWPDQHRIYVREVQKISGGAGGVVMIFDEDADDVRFPWKMTWHGEHEQESDMAFYATPMGTKIVGPGIARCEYGGLMMMYPPRRLMDVWSDPFYSDCQTKAEILLLAALEYSKEKHVVYVASKPPRSIFRTWANRLGRKVVYIPIGGLSPVSVKKIRVFHVLSGHHLREIARDYVW